MIEVNQDDVRECLYLQKKVKDKIFLNYSQLLKQHQINGLRFLFRQFKKKKPAAIVNFPPECGKSVTVALFLNVLKDIIKKPILILCNNQSEINIWNEIILNWTDYTADDIAIESSNVYIRKKIFIKQLENLTPYLRRSWSTLIIKDDINKSTLKLVFDADFKIWITSTDVKKDLKMLSLTYNWLTKSTMDAKDFVPSGNTLKEKIEKKVRLDCFLEDFLMQETRVEPFRRPQMNRSRAIGNNEECTPKKSRKNKDASGTKIKRSKRIIEDNEISVNDCQNEVVAKNNEVINDQNNDNDESSESLLQNYEKLNHNTNMDVDDGITEQYTFSKAIQDIVETENMPSNKSTESLNNDEIPMNNNDFFNEVNESCGNDMDVSILDNDKCQIKEEMTDIAEHTACDAKSVEFISTEYKNVGENMELGDKLGKNDLVLQEAMNTKVGTGLEVKSECHKDIDTKISELEEKALKKFKGSLLDSIF